MTDFWNADPVSMLAALSPRGTRTVDVALDAEMERELAGAANLLLAAVILPADVVAILLVGPDPNAFSLLTVAPLRAEVDLLVASDILKLVCVLY